MRFLANGSHLDSTKRLTRLSLGMGLVFIIAFWISNILIFKAKMGFSLDSIVEHYLGDEEAFKAPVSYLGLLEITHAHLFAYALMLLLLNHLLVFAYISSGWKIVLMVLTYLSAMLDTLSGWLIVYVSTAFAVVKLTSFIVLEASMGIGIVLIAWSLLSPK